MARIRTVKPEFWTSEQVVECSIEARLLFLGMWNFCDDQGIHPGSTKRLKMEIFPADDFDSASIRRMIDELINNELLIEYQSDRKVYWRVTGWDHQKIDRPTNKYPLPTDDTRREINERSPPEGKGREGKGKEGKGINTQSESRSACVIPTDWHPDENSVAWAINLGATREFIENTLVPGFVAYWRDTDDKKKSWNQTFLRNPVVKREIGHFKARQKQYGTQASGSASPSGISAKREHHKRISDFAGQYLDDEPIEPDEQADSAS